MGQQSIHRGIRAMRVAAWSAENTYGTSYLIRGARSMGVDLVVESDELRGDDIVLDQFTKIIAADVTWEIATVDLELMDILVGGTLVSNASYEDLKITENDDVPYVAMAGRIVGSGATRDLHLFIPKAKLSGNLAVRAQLDTYLLPGAQFRGVSEGAINGIGRFRNFSVPTALEIPLRTTTGGL